MSLVTTLLLFPITGPIAGIRWTLEKVQRMVEEELVDDSRIKEELMELQVRLELGDIDEDEYVRREAGLMEQLREVRYWRERLGVPTSGGLVRVARSEPSAE
jgi:Gas vesicle protein G